MRLRSKLFLCIALLALGSTPASAELPLSFGVQANYADDFDFGIGGRIVADTGEVVENSRAMASFDFYFPDGNGADVTFWEININAHYLFPLEDAPVGVYAGAGLHIYNVSVDLDLDTPFGDFGGSADDSGAGLNILGGVDFTGVQSVTPFAELKLELGGAEQFIITGGVRF